MNKRQTESISFMILEFYNLAQIVTRVIWPNFYRDMRSITRYNNLPEEPPCYTLTRMRIQLWIEAYHLEHRIIGKMLESKFTLTYVSGFHFPQHSMPKPRYHLCPRTHKLDSFSFLFFVTKKIRCLSESRSLSTSQVQSIRDLSSYKEPQKAFRQWFATRFHFWKFFLTFRYWHASEANILRKKLYVKYSIHCMLL